MTKAKEKMTREQLAKQLNLSPNYLKYHWNLVVQRYEKRGILLCKKGREPNAEYSIKFPTDSDYLT